MANPQRVVFESQFERGSADECWLWQGRLGTHGYGTVGRTGLAHRIAWERSNGPIPEGLTIDHLCRNRPCVNPAHLRLLTNVDNARMNGNWLKTHCKRGHEFTPENIYISPSGLPTHRRCRACCKEGNRIWRASNPRRRWPDA